MRSSPRIAAARRRGIALLVALMLLTVLAVLVAQFTYSSVIDYRIAKNEEAHGGQALAAPGGIYVCEAFLKSYFARSQGVFALQQKAFAQYTGIGAEGGGSAPARASEPGAGEVTIELREQSEDGDPNKSGDSAGKSDTGSDGGYVSPQNSRIELTLQSPPLVIQLREDNGRINLNNLLVEERRPETERWIRNLVAYMQKEERFFQEHLADDFADKLLGAMGPPGGSPAGGEGGTSQGDGRPREDIAALLSAPELYKDKGKDLETILYGRKADDESSLEEVRFGLMDLFTAWGEGVQGRLNLNTCAPELLFAILPEKRPNPDPQAKGQYLDVPHEERKKQWEALRKRRDEAAIAQVDQLAQLQGLEKIFESLPAPGTQPAAGTPPAPGGTPPPDGPRNVLYLNQDAANPPQPGGPLPLKEMLTISSADFRARIIVQSDELSTEFFARFRYTSQGFRLIIFDEVEPRRAAAPPKEAK